MAVCGCKNGRGRPKAQHKSREAAIEQAMTKRYLKRGGPGHEPYPCPKMPGVFHLRTVRR